MEKQLKDRERKFSTDKSGCNYICMTLMVSKVRVGDIICGDDRALIVNKIFHRKRTKTFRFECLEITAKEYKGYLPNYNFIIKDHLSVLIIQL